MKKPTSLLPPQGRLGVLLPGMGAVATTTIAGVMLARQGKAVPIGSLTQLGTVRLGKRTDKRAPKIADFVPLASLGQLEFGGWDIFPDDAFEAAQHAKVLEAAHRIAREVGARVDDREGPSPGAKFFHWERAY